MKKLAFLVLLLVGAGLFSAFAITEEEAMAAIGRLEALEGKVGTANLAASIGGSATLTFGVDLDNGWTGFANATTSTLRVTLVANNTQTKGAADAEVYGWIELKDILIQIDQTNALTARPGAVSARLYLGPAYINILGRANSVDMATHGQGLAPAFVVTAATVTNVVNTFTNEFNGLEIVVPVPDVLTLSIAVASKFDWLAAGGANVDNIYNFRAGVNLTAVAGLTLELAANLSTETGTNFGFGAKAGYAITLAEEGPIRSLTPQVGFDLVGSEWQLGAGLRLGFAGAARADQTYFGAARTFNPGLSVGLSTSNAVGSPMDLNVVLFDGDLIPVLNLIALFELPLTTGVNRMGLGVRADADLGVVNPYATFRFATSAGTTTDTFLTVGTDIKTLVPNTTFTLTFTSRNLATAFAAGTPGSTITFATRIAY